MIEPANILISLDERHTTNFLNGSKSVELRRRSVNIPPDSYVWIYTKLPRGCVEAYARVEKVISDTPAKIWNEYRNYLALSKCEFDQYLEFSETATVIIFNHIEALDSPIFLSDIRAEREKFQPPQFFKRLGASDPELALFQSAMSW